MTALTSAGARHIETLHLNRLPHIEHRRFRRLKEAFTEWFSQKEARLAELEKEVTRLKGAAQRKKKVD